MNAFCLFLCPYPDPFDLCHALHIALLLLEEVGLAWASPGPYVDADVGVDEDADVDGVDPCHLGDVQAVVDDDVAAAVALPAGRSAVAVAAADVDADVDAAAVVVAASDVFLPGHLSHS